MGRATTDPSDYRSRSYPRAHQNLKWRKERRKPLGPGTPALGPQFGCLALYAPHSKCTVTTAPKGGPPRTRSDTRGIAAAKLGLRRRRILFRSRSTILRPLVLRSGAKTVGDLSSAVARGVSLTLRGSPHRSQIMPQLFKYAGQILG